MKFFSEVSGTTSVPIVRVCWCIGSTKTDDSTPEDGEGVGSRNVRKPSYLDPAVCPRKCHGILSLRKLQGLHSGIYQNYITTEKGHMLKEEASEHF